MLIPDKEKAIELINRSMPYSNQIKNWDLSGKDAVRFEWRGDRFRVCLIYCSVEEVGNCVLIGSNIAILLTQLLKQNLGIVL